MGKAVGEHSGLREPTNACDVQRALTRLEPPRLGP